MQFGSASPVMREELFQGQGGRGFGTFGGVDTRKNVMTVSGAVNTSAILLMLCIAASVGSWMLVTKSSGLGMIVAISGLVVGLICSLVMWFKPAASPFAAPVYAIAEGLLIGAVSWIYAEQAAGTKLGGATGSGIVLSASIATFSVLGVMLSLYKLGIIRATAKFRAVMMVVGGAIGVFCVVMLGLSLFGMKPAFLMSGPIAIGITAVILVWGAFLLILNFDFIEQGAASEAPKYMEWYAGFGLLSTLVLIYIEVLRLLSLLNRRD